MALEVHDVISVRDFDREQILAILDLASDMAAGPRPDLLQGKVLAALFFEPSTRTRLSFESAMQSLGGEVVSVSSGEASSVAKGETLSDSVRVVEGYCDVIVLRHPLEGAARLAADLVEVPVINAGDGAHEHPTQTFLDLFTIHRSFGRLDGLNIGFLGDLKYGRTVHSLVTAMTQFESAMWFLAPPSLQMPDDLVSELKEQNVEFHQQEALAEALPHLDALYCTRIQKERFGDPAEYERVRGTYRLNLRLLQGAGAKPELKVLHPLPRVDELSPDLDRTPHALYFQQAHNGIPTRQALLALVLGRI